MADHDAPFASRARTLVFAKRHLGVQADPIGTPALGLSPDEAQEEGTSWPKANA
jgi:hypothetical protein